MVFVKRKWLDGATSTGVSEPIELVGVFNFGVEVVTTGNPSFTLKFQGSVDGESWRDLTIITGQTTSWVQEPKPVGHVRLDLADLTGGSSPTVTVSLVAQEL